VSANLNRDPMAPDRLTRTFRKLAAEAGLPPVRRHDLRHGAATLAQRHGVGLHEAQDMFGHSSIVLPVDTARPHTIITDARKEDNARSERVRRQRPEPLTPRIKSPLLREILKT
jgi:integrase